MRYFVLDIVPVREHAARENKKPKQLSKKAKEKIYTLKGKAWATTLAKYYEVSVYEIEQIWKFGV